MSDAERRHVLVTGASGEIGTVIVAAFVASRHHVMGFDLTAPVETQSTLSSRVTSGAPRTVRRRSKRRPTHPVICTSS